MMDSGILSTGARSATQGILDTLRKAWPEHLPFVEKSFASRSPELLQSTEVWADRILRIVSSTSQSLEKFCDDYRFLCGKVLEEEIHFRRNGTYRLKKFEDAYKEVYSDHVFMDRYMNFLLLSHVLWDNHANAMHDFETKYLASLPPGSRHLEIGPGHGLLLYCAAESANVAELVGWDVSPTSIEQTKLCMQALKTPRAAKLVLQNLFEAPQSAMRYDSVVLAEVLEHLEDPVSALKSVARHMAPQASLWIHVPINSPAPDHLYLLKTPEEAVDLVSAGGFTVTQSAFYPMSGSTLEKAKKHQLTISAVITARLQ
jgi:2-polyprenyl-3-methyl-5-hydroxy-6-metoxy-1,4-benzoquinol methylase